MHKLGISFLVIVLFLCVMEAKASDENIVNPRQLYTYDMLEKDIFELKEKYPDLISIKSIGTTSFDRDIWAVKLGNAQISIMINGAHHGREWITTALIMEMIEEYARSYVNNSLVHGMDTKILDNVSIWFVPMVNPDGVSLQQDGLRAFPQSFHEDLLEMNEGSYDFRRWKANGEGIDLNRNYPAKWNNLVDVAEKPSYKTYKGNFPAQAKEVEALIDFTYEIDPQIAVAYHTTGRILYWYFFNNPENVARDKCIARKLSYMTGYKLVPKHKVSEKKGAGYTDWFIQEFNRPGFTPELSYFIKERNPPLSIFEEEWARNKAAGLMLANEGYQVYRQETWKKFNRGYPCNFPEKDWLDFGNLSNPR